MNEEQPLREPLLPTRGGTGRNGNKGAVVDMSPNGRGKRESSPDGRSGGATDSFVYHVVRSQQERTVTTI